jgi:hypothetical protein
MKVLIELFDLQELLGGKGFDIPIKLALNGLATSTISLADTRANGVNFIDTRYAIELAKFFSQKFYQLPETCLVQGYNSCKDFSITHLIIFHL